MRDRVRRGNPLPYDVDLDTRAAPSAEECAAERLGSARALALLSLLTPDQRQVVSLRVLGDLTLQQTAEVLGRDIGTVKSLQHRGLARLRRSVEQECADVVEREPREKVLVRPYPDEPVLRWEPRHV